MCHQILISILALAPAPVLVQDLSATVNWNNIIVESKTTTTLQSVVVPGLLKGSTIHGAVLKSLRSVAADYVR